MRLTHPVTRFAGAGDTTSAAGLLQAIDQEQQLGGYGIVQTRGLGQGAAALHDTDTACVRAVLRPSSGQEEPGKPCSTNCFCP